ncbi:trypsin inhibitor-like [Leptopilina heterotoma]|uniref:trypsin inhibitor-like n=1 Tax=Leptopilina heterotoma TaxID=63436 RepID=UPI001CA91280|nr:trypsin inhibitor-like [Leptopilina heterotoma]
MNYRLLIIFLFTFIIAMPEICLSQSICDLPIDAGPCRRYRRRYAFSNTSRNCVSFTYGGCLGNANNFATLEECKRNCTSS